MCLIAFAYKTNPRYPLIVAANRDEFLDRPTVPAHFWPDLPGILAGRDGKALGTWVGITTNGRFAAVTNFRDLRRAPVNGPSRGLLVRDALLAEPPPDQEPMDGYNLLHGTVEHLRFRSNISGADERIAPGVHGLSNALLNTPWPKVRRAVSALQDVAAMEEPGVEAIFSILSDERSASDSELPDTGLDLERERALSSIRIAMPGYGTHCSTVILVSHNGEVRFEERTHATGFAVRERFVIQ
ncbi:MAG: NRDE family protein [Flavobacteriales bacterium]|nr:NRDE family protein [Flavobacteriales bacterium]